MLNKVLPIKISPEQYSQLKMLAKQEQLSMGAVIRAALQKELKQHNLKAKLSELSRFAQAFPSDHSHKTDDEVAYDL